MPYREAAILVTTFCNRQCPDCCYRIPKHETLKAEHYTWDYFERAATFLGNLDVLYISGGEPTIHPNFHEIIHNFRALFKPRILELVTNGFALQNCVEDFEALDRIWISNFDTGGYSQSAIAAVAAWNRGRLAIQPPYHRDLNSRGGGKPCARQNIAAYAAGRLYPCCVAPGIPGAGSLEPCDDWRDRLYTVPLACDRCCFSEG